MRNIFRATAAGLWKSAAALLLASACSSPSGHQTTAVGGDRWLTGYPQVDRNSCSEIDDALVLPVMQARRPEAIGLLESVAYRAIDEQQASRLTEISSQKVNGFVTAKRLVNSAIVMLEERQELVTKKHTGSFVVADSDRIERLRRLSRDPAISDLAPYLVRGVAKNEATGGFFVSQCGSDLVVSHSSLGTSVPPSIQVPVVVFLAQAPRAVFVVWGMAQ